MKIFTVIATLFICFLYAAVLAIFRMGSLQSRIEEEELRNDG